MRGQTPPELPDVISTTTDLNPLRRAEKKKADADAVVRGMRETRLDFSVARSPANGRVREMQTEPINQRNAIAREMETWALVAELAKALYDPQRAIPALIALRIVISYCIRHMHDPADALRLFIADLNAALDQMPARPN